MSVDLARLGGDIRWSGIVVADDEQDVVEIALEARMSTTGRGGSFRA